MKIPSYDIEVQQKFISYVFNNYNSYDFSLDEKYITDKKLNVLYRGVHLLREKNIENFHVDELLPICLELDNTINFNFLNDIKNAYMDFTNIDFTIDDIKNNYAKTVISKEILEDILSETNKAGCNKNRLLELANKIQTTFLETEDKEHLLTAKDLVKNHVEVLENRMKGITQRSLGHKTLNALLTYPAAPGEMTIMYGDKGSGKSAFVKVIENMLINQQVPVVSFNLEMTKEITFDRLLCTREGLTLHDLSMKEMDKRNMAILYRGLERFKNINNYIFSEKGGLTIAKLDNLIYKAKSIFRKENVFKNNDEYMIVIIDLLSMLKDFSGADPRGVENAIDTLHEIYKKHNIHLLGVLQSNENKWRKGKGVKDPETLDNTFLSIEEVKNGAAYAERARVVISLNRPIYLKKRFFPDMIDIWNMEDDIIKAHVVKQNNGNLGCAEFLFEPERFRITPYLKEGVKKDSDKV